MRLVEQGEASREKLAIDDALAEPRDDAETDASRQLGQRLADAAHIVRVDVLETVAQDDPVDRPPVALRARLARVPDEFGVEARPRRLKRRGLALPDQVAIDEAVVARRHQRVDRKSTRLNSMH